MKQARWIRKEVVARISVSVHKEAGAHLMLERDFTEACTGPGWGHTNGIDQYSEQAAPHPQLFSWRLL